MKVTLTIDPGLTGTGVAVWKASKFYSDKFGLLDVENFKSKNKDWTLRCLEIEEMISTYLKERNYKVDAICIEYPMVFQSSMGAAIVNRGDLFKLSSLIGCLFSLASSSRDILLVSPIKWKGQLSKELCEERFRKILLKKKYRKPFTNVDHCWDAVGIGLYYIKLF